MDETQRYELVNDMVRSAKDLFEEKLLKTVNDEIKQIFPHSKVKLSSLSMLDEWKREYESLIQYGFHGYENMSDGTLLELKRLMENK